MLSAFAPPAPAPAPGEAWLETLDVGQGLAVVVRTAGHALLYEAGPAYGPDADAGARVVAPYLRAAGVARLDAVVLTHEKTDHVGGAASVLEAFEVGAMYSSLRASHPLLVQAPDARRCTRGLAWEWDGVRFTFLHPGPETRAGGRVNNLSCVPRIAARGRAMLLTGDIERAAEALLSERAAEAAHEARAPGSRPTCCSCRITAAGARRAPISSRPWRQWPRWCRSATATASGTLTRACFSATARAACACCAPIATAPSRCISAPTGPTLQAERAAAALLARARLGG